MCDAIIRWALAEISYKWHWFYDSITLPQIELFEASMSQPQVLAAAIPVSNDFQRRVFLKSTNLRKIIAAESSMLSNCFKFQRLAFIETIISTSHRTFMYASKLSNTRNKLNTNRMQMTILVCLLSFDYICERWSKNYLAHIVKTERGRLWL